LISREQYTQQLDKRQLTKPSTTSSIPMPTLVPNIINALGDYVNCPSSNYFEKIQNTYGFYDKYCCDTYNRDELNSWGKYYDETSKSFANLPDNWVIKISSYVSNYLYGSGIAYGTAVEYKIVPTGNIAIRNERGLVPALMRNKTNPSATLCCELPLIQDRENFKCCDENAYSVSEHRCCPDQYRLEMDKCVKLAATSTTNTTTQISSTTDSLATTSLETSNIESSSTSTTSTDRTTKASSTVTTTSSVLKTKATFSSSRTTTKPVSKTTSTNLTTTTSLTPSTTITTMSSNSTSLTPEVSTSTIPSVTNSLYSTTITASESLTVSATSTPTEALISNVINASGALVSCPSSHYFRNYQNPFGEKFGAYCCDHYDPYDSWTHDYEALSATHPEFPKNWVIELTEEATDWELGSGIAFGALVGWQPGPRGYLSSNSTFNKGIVPALMKNRKEPRQRLCCESPLVQDRENFKCCGATRYSISEKRCCPDKFVLEKDKCVVLTSVSLTAETPGATFAVNVQNTSRTASNAALVIQKQETINPAYGIAVTGAAALAVAAGFYFYKKNAKKTKEYSEYSSE